MDYKKVIEKSEFEEKKRKHVFKNGNKQILLLGVGSQVFALDNRCPHEGYPLSEGTQQEEDCVLTCNWHNWKFDLKNGKCLIGGDNVQTYPVELRDNAYFVDTSGPSKEEVQENILEGLKVAFKKRQYGRLGRELTRLDFNGINPLIGIKKAILWSYDKFEYGMTHAYAGLADWLSLYDKFEERLDKLVCLTEAIDHIAYDSLRHPSYSFPKKGIPYNKDEFLLSIENEENKKAEAMVIWAYENGLSFKDLEKPLVNAALRHYSDFGHSAIYVDKVRYLSNYFTDPEVDKAITLSIVRSLCFQTREDLIPEFKRYDERLGFLKKFSKEIVAGEKGFEKKSFSLLENKRAQDSMDWYIDEREKGMAIPEIYSTLLYGLAKNFLQYDMKYQFNDSGPVTQNVGWLDFSHGLTFANAIRKLCYTYPEFWEEGLLQLSCFYGRNTPYINQENQDSFKVEDPKAFKNKVIEKILDHGMALPIYSCHVLKTALAVFDEAENIEDSEVREILYQSFNRFLNSPLKAKHTKRTVMQGIQLVQKDFQ